MNGYSAPFIHGETWCGSLLKLHRDETNARTLWQRYGNVMAIKNGAKAPFHVLRILSSVDHTENDEPQPQVVEAFGFLITNWAPLMSSL